MSLIGFVDVEVVIMLTDTKNCISVLRKIFMSI